MDPDVVAQAFGFTSGDALIKALLDTIKPKDMIDNVTDQIMLQRHGDVADPKQMQLAAEAAVANEAHAKFVATELKWLNKAVPKKQDVLPVAAKNFANTAIGKKQVKSIQ